MEQWREIPGYEGLYQASDEGKVRRGERVLKTRLCRDRNGRDDVKVNLWRNNTQKTFLLSRLIARAWCGGYRDGLTVNHIDGNPLNNRAENLEWVTLSENIRKSYETGLHSAKPVILIDTDGMIYRFRSKAQASRFLGMNDGYISNMAARGHRIVRGYLICLGGE